MGSAKIIYSQQFSELGTFADANLVPVTDAEASETFTCSKSDHRAITAIYNGGSGVSLSPGNYTTINYVRVFNKDTTNTVEIVCQQNGITVGITCPPGGAGYARNCGTATLAIRTMSAPATASCVVTVLGS